MTPDRRAALMRDMPIDFAWGGAGLADLHGRCDVFVVLDVLCFTTSVDVAVARGAEVLPFPIGKYGADVLARADGAILAKPRQEAAGGPSLSPASLRQLAPGTHLGLPSPTGSSLSRSEEHTSDLLSLMCLSYSIFRSQ